MGKAVITIEDVELCKDKPSVNISFSFEPDLKPENIFISHFIGLQIGNDIKETMRKVSEDFELTVIDLNEKK